MRKRVTKDTEGHKLLRDAVAKSSQREVSRKSGVAQQDISRYLSLGFRPADEKRAAFYAAFGWHPFVWLTDDERARIEAHGRSVKSLQTARKRRKRSVQTTSKRAA